MELRPIIQLPDRKTPIRKDESFTARCYPSPSVQTSSSEIVGSQLFHIILSAPTSSRRVGQMDGGAYGNFSYLNMYQRKSMAIMHSLAVCRPPCDGRASLVAKKAQNYPPAFSVWCGSLHFIDEDGRVHWTSHFTVYYSVRVCVCVVLFLYRSSSSSRITPIAEYNKSVIPRDDGNQRGRKAKLLELFCSVCRQNDTYRAQAGEAIFG